MLTIDIFTPMGVVTIDYQDGSQGNVRGNELAIGYLKMVIDSGIIYENGYMVNYPPSPYCVMEVLNGTNALLCIDHPDDDLTADPDAIKFDEAVDDKAHEAQTSPNNDLPEPSQLQKEAGNYKKGRIKVSGLNIAIENPCGSERSGVDKDGKQWSNKQYAHYGYIERTDGADGDEMDVYVKEGTDDAWCGDVFVVNQVFEDTGKFDEHKCMIGFDNEDEAVENYLSNYSVGWTGLGSVDKMSFENFKRFANP